jgi:hypothetical protein
MRAALAAGWVGLLVACKPSFAAPPVNLTPDPLLQAWFKSLQQPTTGRLCCAVSDCRLVDFEIQDGHYEIQVDGWRYSIPTEIIIEGMASPTGRAVACYTYSDFGAPLPPGTPRNSPQDTIEILCFVPPHLSS